MSTPHSLRNVDRLSQLFFLESSAKSPMSDPEPVIFTTRPHKKKSSSEQRKSSYSTSTSTSTSTSEDRFFKDTCRVPRIFRDKVEVAGGRVPRTRREWTDVEGRKTGLLTTLAEEARRHMRPSSLDSSMLSSNNNLGPVRRQCHKKTHRNSAPSYVLAASVPSTTPASRSIPTPSTRAPSIPAPAPRPPRPILTPIITNFEPRRSSKKQQPPPKLEPLQNPQPMYPKYLAAAGPPPLPPTLIIPPAYTVATATTTNANNGGKKIPAKKFIALNPDPKSSSPEEQLVVKVLDEKVKPRPVRQSTDDTRLSVSAILPPPPLYTRSSYSATFAAADTSLETPETTFPVPSELGSPRPLPLPPRYPARLNSQVLKAIDDLLEQVSTKPLPPIPPQSHHLYLQPPERRFSTTTIWSHPSALPTPTEEEDENRRRNKERQRQQSVDWSEVEKFLTKGGKKFEPDVDVQTRSVNSKLVKDLLKMRVAQAGLVDERPTSMRSQLEVW